MTFLALAASGAWVSGAEAEGKLGKLKPPPPSSFSFFGLKDDCRLLFLPPARYPWGSTESSSSACAGEAATLISKPKAAALDATKAQLKPATSSVGPAAGCAAKGRCARLSKELPRSAAPSRAAPPPGATKAVAPNSP